MMNPTPIFIEKCSIKNHKIFLKKISKMLKSYNSLIWIDIDKFTQINNLFGKDCGDAIINTIIKILFNFTKRNDVEVYHAKKRDEFFIILRNYEFLSGYAQIIISLIQQYDWSKIIPDMYITCSAGIAEYGTSSIDTIKRARVSLNLVKSKGGNGVGPEIFKLHPYELVRLSES